MTVPAMEALAVEVHEAADIFPLDEESIPGLADDIRANGLLTPIERYEGKLLDGRRRLRACELAGVPPTFKDVKPADPVAYVLSLNLHRRHLTVSQVAMVGARAREVYDEQAKQRQKARKGNQPGATPKNSSELPSAKCDSRDAVGKAVGVSGFTIDCATRVLNDAVPELVKAVDDGRVTVSHAAKLTKESPEVQREAAVAERPVKQSKVSAVASAPPEALNTPPVDPVRAQKQRAKALELAQGAIDLLRKIGGDNPGREEAFRMVRSYMKANP